MLDSMSTFWWILAGVLVAVELATGTFYLLMLALGAAAAAVADWIGLQASAQVVVAAVVGGGATALWHARRAHEPKSEPAPSNPDVQMDIGQTVQVSHWRDDRTARVSYRGSEWDVTLQPGHDPAPGAHRIVAVHGNRLELTPVN